MFLIVYYLIASALAATCTPTTNSNSPTSGDCAADACNVQIGSNVYCSQCAKQGEVPIDGTCTAKDSAIDKCKKDANTELAGNEQVCGACKAGYFLHKGGCYKIGGAVGKLICTDPSTANSPPTAGECKTCASGYFKNPTAAAADKPPCIACNDTTGDGTSMGKAGCATCEPPKSPGVAKCTACLDGYYNNGSGSENDITCAQCTGDCQTCKDANNKCTSCKDASDKKYFKKGDGETGECVANEDACKASNTHFLVADTKTCYLCSDTKNNGIADCQTCTSSKSDGAAKAVTVTCSACATPTKKPNADGTKCVECTAAGCAKCSDEGVCLQCSAGKYLTPTAQCVDDCGKLGGYYKDNNNVCKPCDSSCAACVGANANQCSACPAGKVLKYTNDSDLNQGGSCVDECKANTGGCADCGATIGGSKYCSKCSTTTEVSVNGVCTADNTRTPACSVKDNQGGCTTCASGYFLLDNGCYKLNQQPGSQVCTAESGGKCTQCANGMTVNSQTGVCPSCDPSCKTCGAAAASECASCFSGYYLDSTAKACKKCSENSADNKITGVKDCVSCDPPSSNPGTVTCYVKTSGGGSGDNSTGSDPKLSSGAIAGISVAAVVVVGGLVGFLCWWFICRGKA